MIQEVQKILTPKGCGYISLGLFLSICGLIYIADTTDDHFLLTISEKFPHGDKINHFTLFGSLTFFTNVAFSGKRIFLMEKGSILILIFCLLEEFSQIFFPTRDFDLFDLLFDLLGVLSFTYLSRKVVMSNEKMIADFKVTKS